jgi:hypothetical protein
MADTVSSDHEVQSSFGNSKDIHIHRVCSETRPYLAMIRAGSHARSMFFSEPIPEKRTFDVAISYYALPHADDVGFSTADIIVAGGLSKFHAAKQFLESTAYHERYKGVIFLDDDLELLFDLDDFFTFCESNALHLAQASISNTPDSFATWSLTRNHPGLVMRETNFVEVMAPFFAKDFLKEMLPSFDMTISTWGLDVFWGHHLGSVWKAAIIDQFEMKHKKPVSLSGPFYQHLASIGVDPWADKTRIFDAIGLDHYDIRPLHFVPRDQAVPRVG